MAVLSTSQRLSEWLDRAVETWMGYTLAGAEQAISESGWRQDDRSIYCPRCGEIVGEGEVVVVTGQGGRASCCGWCRGKRLPYQAVVRLGSYSDPLREWILGVKYQNWAEMAEALGRRLGAEVRRAAAVDLKKALVVPMPMPWQRRLYRGMDHAASLAEAVARELGVPMAKVLAKRNGPPQVSLPRSRRKVNLRGRIMVRKRLRVFHLEGRHVILVDDVRTTGTSLKAAARRLQTLNPQRLVAAVLAVSDGAARRIFQDEADGCQKG